MKSPKNAPARCSMSAPISREPISKVRSRAKGVSRPMPLPFMPPNGGDLVEMMPSMLFDRLARRRHRDRAADRGCVEFLHREVADRLIERADDVKREIRVAVDLGAHYCALSR